MDPVERGKHTLRIEAEAIGRLPDRLGEDFAKAVNIIRACKGRVVVSGMGKSGLVGQKVAATLASVGVPSLFLHSAEGVHGDLGMATNDDVVLAYSYSGETEELLQLLPVFGRLGIPVIAITGDKNSTLAEVAEVVLDVAVEKEACPMNLTPTASSTASLAMGDALAMAVLEASGFREEDFARFHPGGVLGKRLRRVGDLMFSGDSVPKVRESAPLVEVIHEMGNKSLGMTCVVNDGDRLAGIITDGDLRRALEASNGLLNADAKALMSSSPKTVGPGEMAEAALRIMEDSAITSLIVMEKKERQILGVIHLHHLLRAGVV